MLSAADVAPSLLPRVGVPCACRAAPPALPHDQRVQVVTPEDVDRVVRPSLADRDREHCILLSVDTRSRLLATQLVSVGTVASTFMAPREIYRDALRQGAAAIFLAHNHPSGDPTPSDADRAVTRRLRRAGQTLGLELLDHLVVGDTGFVSLARLGWT